MATSKKNGKSTEELMAPLNALISKGRRDGMQLLGADGRAGTNGSFRG